MSNKELIKKFVTSCSVTFKAFDYKVDPVKSSATIWNFVATNPSGEKVYAVYCAPKLSKAKSLIKLAKKKVNDKRLVVVTEVHTDEELELSKEEGYALLTLEVLEKYGEEMIEVRSRDANQTKSEDPLASSRERVF